MVLFHPDIAAALIALYAAQRLHLAERLLNGVDPGGRYQTQMLSGVQYWIPVPDRYLNEAVSTRGKRSKKPLEAVRREREAQLPDIVHTLVGSFSGAVTEGSLSNHLYCGELSVLLFLLLMSAAEFLFDGVLSLLGYCASNLLLYVLMVVFFTSASLLFRWMAQLSPSSAEVKLIGLFMIGNFVVLSLYLAFEPVFMDFHLRQGLEDFYGRVQSAMESMNRPASSPHHIYALGLLLCVGATLLSGILFMPTFRYVQTYLHFVSLPPPKSVFAKALHHLEFFLPILLTLSFVKPLMKNLLVSPPVDCLPSSPGVDCLGVEASTPGFPLSLEAWNSLRLWAIVLYGVLRLVNLRSHVQAVEDEMVEVLSRAPLEKGANESFQFELKHPHRTVYRYLCIAAVQFLAPALLVLSLALVGSVPGGWSFGVATPLRAGLARLGVVRAFSASEACRPVRSSIESVWQSLVARATDAIHPDAMRLMSPSLVRNVSSFLLFWLFLVLSAQSALGYLYWRVYLPGGSMERENLLQKLRKDA